MPQTLATSDKRERESPGVSGPLCKQSKMAEGKGVVDKNLPLSKNDEKLDKMLELLESLKKGQESLQKKHLTANLKNLEMKWLKQYLIRYGR